MLPALRLNIFALLLFVPLLYGCGNSGDDAAVPDIANGDIYLPVEAKLVHGTLFVVRVMVNGEMYLDMLVDTGSSRTYVPAELFGNLDGLVHISSLCFDNNVCFNSFMALSSDSGFTQSKEGYFNGIIGIDLLKNFDLTMDYKNESIYFYDLLESDSSGCLNIPIQYQSTRPFANVSIEEMSQGTTLLDTGAAYTRITSLMLDSLDQNPEVLFKSVIFNYDASEVVEYVPINEYCTGTACTDEVIVQIGSWPAVGGTFFREYLTTFKFSENVVKLDRYSDRNHIEESGIQRIGLQVNIRDASEIVYVIEGSLAWEGGIRDGNEIVSVNGIPIASLGYFGIYDLLSDTSIKEYQLLIINNTGDVQNILISTEE